MRKLSKGLNLLVKFEKATVKVIRFFDGLKNWTKTIDSALKHINAFKDDVVRIWGVGKLSEIKDVGEFVVENKNNKE